MIVALPGLFSYLFWDNRSYRKKNLKCKTHLQTKPNFATFSLNASCLSRETCFFFTVDYHKKYTIGLVRKFMRRFCFFLMIALFVLVLNCATKNVVIPMGTNCAPAHHPRSPCWRFVSVFVTKNSLCSPFLMKMRSIILTHSIQRLSIWMTY